MFQVRHVADPSSLGRFKKVNKMKQMYFSGTAHEDRTNDERMAKAGLHSPGRCPAVCNHSLSVTAEAKSRIEEQLERMAVGKCLAIAPHALLIGAEGSIPCSSAALPAGS